MIEKKFSKQCLPNGNKKAWLEADQGSFPFFHPFVKFQNKSVYTNTFLSKVISNRLSYNELQTMSK